MMRLNRPAVLAVPSVVLLLAMAPLSTDRTAPADPLLPSDGIAAPAAGPPAPVAADAPADLDVELAVDGLGRSDKLKAWFAGPGAHVDLPLAWGEDRPAAAEYRWVPVMGTPGTGASGAVGSDDRVRAPERAGVYELELLAAGASRRFADDLRLVVTVPFERKRDGYIGRYFMGTWPTEGSGRRDRYAPPAHFIEVTKESQHLQVSEHFKLKEFLTHDQGGVWPKYVVLDGRLLDKLELVMDELNGMGVPARHMIVMSGFRTPQYNRQGLSRGRASLSRHQFGDAADVWVDNDGDWYMDDLNGDGRRDTRDARVMLRAMERVESRHPGLLGGGGIYPDNGAHGPFIHIDVRGRKARW